MMAKIGTAEVDTLNIAQDDLTEVAKDSAFSAGNGGDGTLSVQISNPEDRFVRIYASALYTLGGNNSSATASCTLKVRRVRGDQPIYGDWDDWQGNGGKQGSFSCEFVDTNALAGDTYEMSTTIQFNAQTSGANFDERHIAVFAEKV